MGSLLVLRIGVKDRSVMIWGSVESSRATDQAFYWSYDHCCDFGTSRTLTILARVNIKVEASIEAESG